MATILGTSFADDLLGSNAQDNIAGFDGDDVLRGGGGNDLLLGGTGNDRLMGGNGFDTLFGGKNDDILQGGSGGDWLSGDEGSDELSGGFGADTFYFNGNTAFVGSDTITDFSLADGDTIAFGKYTGTNDLIFVQVGLDVEVYVDLGGDLTPDYLAVTVLNSTVADVDTASSFVM